MHGHTECEGPEVPCESTTATDPVGENVCKGHGPTL